MSVFRCFLLLALIVAVTATACKKHKREHRHGHIGHHHGKKCDHGKKGHGKHDLHGHKHKHGIGKCYVRPKNKGGVCLGSLGFLGLGVKKKAGLRIVSHIFNFYSKKGAPSELDEGIELIVNLSRGVSVMLDEFIPGLGGYFREMVIGSIRYIFCAMRNPWEKGCFIDRWFGNKRTKAPAICGKSYGRKWGWKKYLKGYSGYSEMDEVYHFSKMRSYIEDLVEVKAGLKISSLKGTRRLIVDIMIKYSILLGRKPDSWSREDFIIMCRYVITIVAACGRAYREGTGIAIIEELVIYINVLIKNYKFKTSITEYETIMKEEIKSCDSESFNGALVTENETEVQETSNQQTEVAVEENTAAEDDAASNAKVTVTERVIEYDVWYDENGNVINETRTDY